MEDLDLDINNYDLEDILNVFKLDYQFDNDDLKMAYRMMLKTHPDKSGLNKDVFLFFNKAYDVLKKIYYFRNRKKLSTHKRSYEEETSKEKEILLKKLDGKSVKEFNKWFNDMFEKNKVSDEDFDNGYGEWYKNKEPENNEKVSLNDFDRVFEKKKRECKAIVVKNDNMEINHMAGYSLSREAPPEYSSDVFSKLKFEDLKKAHTETVIPVTREDFENKRRFHNVENYRNFRAQQDTSALSLDQSKAFLKKKDDEMKKMDSMRIYNILKKDEEVAMANQKWWSHLRQLENTN